MKVFGILNFRWECPKIPGLPADFAMTSQRKHGMMILLIGKERVFMSLFAQAVTSVLPLLIMMGFGFTIAKKPWFLLVEIVFQNQDLGSRCAHC